MSPSSPFLGKLTFAAGFATALLAYALPAQAQGFGILRDTETEEMLRSYEAPLAPRRGPSTRIREDLSGGRSFHQCFRDAAGKHPYMRRHAFVAGNAQ